MENIPKRRGRPRKIPHPMAAGLGAGAGGYGPEVVGEFFAQTLGASRTEANAYYAAQAEHYVELLSKGVEELRGSGELHDPLRLGKMLAGYRWILSRRTVLTELGRMMDDEDPNEQSEARLRHTTEHVAARHDRLTAKAAVAYIHRQRMGETGRRDRVAALHHELNAAINLHRQRYPESTWSDVKAALDLSVGQVERKIPS